MCVHECVIRQLFRLPRSCMRVPKGYLTSVGRGELYNGLPSFFWLTINK